MIQPEVASTDNPLRNPRMREVLEVMEVITQLEEGEEEEEEEEERVPAVVSVRDSSICKGIAAVLPRGGDGDCLALSHHIPHPLPHPRAVLASQLRVNVSALGVSTVE